jgi:hypothetical protein
MSTTGVIDGVRVLVKDDLIVLGIGYDDAKMTWVAMSEIQALRLSTLLVERVSEVRRKALGISETGI